MDVDRLLQEADAAHEAGRDSEAFSKYLRAAKAGNRTSQEMVGHLFEFGEGVAQDLDSAILWYERAYENGLLGCAYRLAKLYMKRRINFEMACFWLEKAGEAGNAQAWYNLGRCYKHGRGIEQSLEKARWCYSEGAKRGHILAERSLIGLEVRLGRIGLIVGVWRLIALFPRAWREIRDDPDSPNLHY